MCVLISNHWHASSTCCHASIDMQAPLLCCNIGYSKTWCSEFDVCTYKRWCDNPGMCIVVLLDGPIQPKGPGNIPNRAIWITPLKSWTWLLFWIFGPRSGRANEGTSYMRNLYGCTFVEDCPSKIGSLPALWPCSSKRPLQCVPPHPL